MANLSRDQIIWIPSHPAQGSISMQRYWAELKAAAEELGKSVEATLDKPVIPVSAARRIERAYKSYVAYPKRCRRMLRERAGGVVHILDHSYTHLLNALPEGWKSVVTVHDLIPFHEPDGMTGAQMTRFRTKMGMLRGADKLVAVSGSTRDDLVGLLGIPEEQIVVIPNGVSAGGDTGGEIGEVVQSVLDGGERFFSVLSIGLTVARKNLSILPDVFRAYKRLDGRRALLIRVGDPLPESLRDELAEVLGGDGLIECGRVSDRELDALYRGVDSLIFPSTYEGFGLPVLEAMSAGCPVAASAIASHREVGGDCVSYFDPEDATAAGRALEAIGAGGGDLLERVGRGKKRATEFTWGRHVEGLFQVYGELGATG